MDLSYNILVHRIPNVAKKLDKIIRRAKKKGLSDFSYVVKSNPVFVKSGEAMLECREVEISVPTVKLNGWVFVGRIQHLHTDDGIENIIYDAPDMEVPAVYRDANSNCEHCNYNRRRNDTFIVQHDDGSFMQVGSTCLTDFLGHDAGAFMARASYIAELTNACGNDDDDYAFDDNKSHAYDVEYIVSLASASFCERGYVAKPKYDEPTSIMPTCDLIRLYLTEKDAEKKEELIPSEFASSGTKLAEKVVEWLKSLTDEDADNNYMSNLQALGKASYCPWKALGILASSVVAYERFQQKNADNALNAKSTHQGEVGKKVFVNDATVIFKRGFESMYGCGNIYKLRDDEGNIYVWFASSNKISMDVGDVIDRFMAKVKKHEEDKYLGGAMTTVVSHFNDDNKAIDRAMKKATKDAEKVAKIVMA